MFIEVTSAKDGKRNLVNLDNVESIFQSGDTSYICYQSESYICVKESYEEIKKMIMK